MKNTQELLASQPFFILNVVLFLVLLGMLLGMLWLVKFYWPREGRHMHHVAQNIARGRWYVHGVETHDKGSWLLLVSESVPRKELSLFFRCSHPDLKCIQALRRLDLIGFEGTDQAIGTELEFELPSHLRLKDRSAWSG